MTRLFSFRISTTAWSFFSSFATVFQITKTRKLEGIGEVVYFNLPRRCNSSNVSSTSRLLSMLKGSILGLMAETFDSHPDFRCIFIYRSGSTCTNPKDSYIEEYSLIKRVIFSTACMFPYILMPFGSSVSKPASAGGIVMPFRAWNKRGDVGRVDVAS